MSSTHNNVYNLTYAAQQCPKAGMNLDYTSAKRNNVLLH